MSLTARGILYTLIASTLWGFSGVFAQYLFHNKGINPEWLVTLRLLIPGFLLLFPSYYMQKRVGRSFLFIWREFGFSLILYSMFGVMAIQLTYFLAVKYSNAPTATVIQYLSPVIVALATIFLTKKLPSRRIVLAVFVALAGTFLIATHGTVYALFISSEALFWGLLSAVSAAFYAMYPVKMTQKWGAVTVLGWGMLFSGIVLSFFVHPWDIHGIWDIATVLSVIYIVIFGSLVAYLLFLMGIQLVGSQMATILCCVEPLSAALAAIAFLGVTFTGADWLGSFLIMMTVVILTKK